MQFFRYRIALFGLFILCLLYCPVYGDMLVPTNTQVFFEKDGQPYNGSVQYTVSCYGHRCNYYSCPPATSPSQEVVYSYSATCEGYGCTIYETYYLNYRQIYQCDIEGMTREGNFTIRNFSNTPIPDCTFPRQIDIVSENNEYYRETPGYRECVNKSFAAADLCEQFLAKCDPASDTECGNWIRDGRYMKDTNESKACRNTADLTRKTCDAYLEKVDPSTLVMWHNIRNGDEYPADRICKQRFVIPSDRNLMQSGKDTVVPQSMAAHSEKQPVWCPFLSIFGISC